jgi:hypothetical protein
VLVVTGVLIGGADFVSGRVGSATWWGSVGLFAITLALSMICLLKGKIVTGVVGIVVWPIGLVGAIRLGKPQSLWSRRRYSHQPLRDRRARTRFDARHETRWNRVRDLIAGAPNPEPIGQRRPAQ